MRVFPARRKPPFTPTLSPEFRGEGALRIASDETCHVSDRGPRTTDHPFARALRLVPRNDSRAHAPAFRSWRTILVSVMTFLVTRTQPPQGTAAAVQTEETELLTKRKTRRDYRDGGEASQGKF